jgi:predicted Zn-dependent protease
MNSPSIRLLPLFRIFAYALYCEVLAVSISLAQSPCEKELAEAEAKYQLGNLDEAIALANSCLEKSDIGSAERERGYLLLGKTHHAKSLLDSAKAYLRKLLVLIPSWRPDPENDSPSFQQLAQEVINEFEKERLAQAQQAQQARQQTKPEAEESVITPSRRNKKWLWIGGGALAAGAAAFLIFQGDDNPPARLPDPPVLPQK